jgi:hypothetical protein
MTDLELVAFVKPPAPLGDAFLTGSEADLEILLDLLYSSHLLICGGEEEYPKWFYTDIGWPIWRLYRDDIVPPVLTALAPTCEDAEAIAKEWATAWPHSCTDYEWWAWRRDDWEDPSIRNYFRDVLTGWAEFKQKSNEQPVIEGNG